MNTFRKTIHYCWFGKNPLPEKAIKCINSWKKYCPGYEIVEWNETNFDVNTCSYIKEAYDAKRWAFVSDYARFWILYKYGGLYFDTDVELIKPIDDLISVGPFMGAEPYDKGTCRIAAGLGLYAEPGDKIYQEVIEHYQGLHFRIAEGIYNDETIVTYITNIAKKHGYKGDGSLEKIGDITIYPPDFFCPMDMNTGELTITENTRSIHWYTASWKDNVEIAIHEKAVEIYTKHPGMYGKSLSSAYENTTKIMYYLKKEGLSSVIKRIMRKLNKKWGGD